VLNYKKLNIEYKHVSEKILEYIKINNIELAPEVFWHFVDNNHFFNAIPELQQMFDPMNLTVKNVGILVTKGRLGPIHVDTTSVMAGDNLRINFPIINCENTLTNFYQSNHTGTTASLHNGDLFTWFYPNTCKLVDSFELNTPTVIRVNVPHQVNVYNPNLLRVACTVFFKENIDYLLHE
jgi:hypothetical protein